jgi:hypothetical protein
METKKKIIFAKEWSAQNLLIQSFIILILIKITNENINFRFKNIYIYFFIKDDYKEMFFFFMLKIICIFLCDRWWKI